MPGAQTSRRLRSKKSGNYNQICRDCQFPKCMDCGEPSKEKWIPNPMQKTERYKCQNCIKHACQGRCQRQLPAHAFDRRANGHRYAVCRECQHPACAACGQKSTEIWTPHPKIPNQVYKCAACEKGQAAGKHPHSCKTCGETEASAFDKNKYRHLYDRCRNCQYPKCSKCAQRSTEIWTPHPKIQHKCTGALHARRPMQRRTRKKRNNHWTIKEPLQTLSLHTRGWIIDKYYSAGTVFAWPAWGTDMGCGHE